MFLTSHNWSSREQEDGSASPVLCTSAISGTPESALVNCSHHAYTGIKIWDILLPLVAMINEPS